jgi:hypothetical protein
VFEYRLLRRIFGPRRDEVTGPRMLGKESRRMRWTGYLARIGEEEEEYKEKREKHVYY